MAGSSKLRRLVRNIGVFYSTAISIFAPLHWLYTHANEWHLLPGNGLQIALSISTYIGDVLLQAFLAAFYLVMWNLVIWHSVHINGFAWLIFIAVSLSFVIWRYLDDDYKEKGAQTREEQVTRVCTRIIAVVGGCSVLTICLIKGVMIASTTSSRERAYGLGGPGLPYMPIFSPHRYYQVCTVLGGIFATLSYIIIGLFIRALILVLKEMYYDEPDESE